ncbi:Phospholipase C [Legionella beliardensis]|uniref:Phospholipase C n=1 Tax=Legionella beliardensis TaxID=91822 RepID=A0A378JPE0_9GAMM|nr:alkaline phosphatase family protein [Legionella beliardensis]STX55756.1 Phospholipase C [Legionella beliardensis]
MKQVWLLIFKCLCFLFFMSTTYAAEYYKETVARVPVPVKVTVANKNWVTTISICNNTAQSISLKDIEFNFNYVLTMPSNIWGSPWVAWKLDSQQGNQVVLVGGTEWSPNLPPDANCSNPMTISFNASPNSPLPTSPFVFKAADGVAVSGTLSVKMDKAPVEELVNPEVTVTGMGNTSKQILPWGQEWRLTNLVSGSYTVTANNITNGMDTYQATPVTVTVKANQTASATVKYMRVAANVGSLTINMQAAPAQELTNPQVTLTGQGITRQQVMNWNSPWQINNLAPGSYKITASNVNNGTDFFSAAPVTANVIAQTSATANVTYTRVSDGRPTSWNNIKHIVMITFENTNEVDAVRQPFMKSLLTTGAYLGDFRATTHPSQPNYFALIGGSTFNVTSNSNVNLDGKHLGDLLIEKGKTWKAYVEDLPSAPCYTGSSRGNYVRKHAPFISFKSVQNNPTICKNIVPANQFFTDLANNNLPSFALYTPNELNDGHDTDVSFSDAWLAQTFGPIFNNPNVMKDTLFILTFDEDAWTEANKVYTAFVGAGVKASMRSNSRYTHYSLLKTIEEIYQLGTLNRNDLSAKLITDIWQP